MKPGVALALAILSGVTLSGCRAQVSTPDGGADLATDDLAMDLGTDDLEVDLAGADLRCSTPIGPEDCTNSCDDDQNGFTDDDDPACSGQVLVTFGGGADLPFLGRLVLGPKPRLIALDGNTVPSGTSGAALQGAFSSSIYLAREGG